MKPKILLIEDHKLTLKVEQAILNAFNCDIDAAETANKGLEYVASNTYSLIITDYGLPDMNGMDFIKALIKRCPSTPIIVLTAHLMEELKNECLNAGAQQFITKPLTLEIAEKIFTTYCSDKVGKQVSNKFFP